MFPEILLIAEAFEETKAFVAEVAVMFPTMIAVPVEELLMPYENPAKLPPLTEPITYNVPVLEFVAPVPPPPEIDPLTAPVIVAIPPPEVENPLPLLLGPPVTAPIILHVPVLECEIPILLFEPPIVFPTIVAEFVPDNDKTFPVLPVVEFPVITTPFNKLKVPPAVAVVVAPSFQSLEEALLFVTEVTVTF